MKLKSKVDKTLWTLFILMFHTRLSSGYFIQTTLRFGTTSTLNCQSGTVDPFGLATFEWFDQNNQLISTSPRLIIQGAEKKDAGMYYCRVAIPQRDGSLRKRERRYAVAVDEFSLGGGAIPKPEFRFLIRDQEVKGEATFNESAWIFLKCVARNGQSYRWTGPKNEKRNSQILYIPNIDSSNAGVYTCYATFNEIGEQSSSINVKIRRISVSIESYPLEKFEVGGRISRKCSQVFASPGSNTVIKWFDPNGRLIVEGDIINMEITRTTPSGVYSCRLFKYNSDIPIAKKDFRVDIKSGRAPRVETIGLSVDQSPKRATEGDSVTLKCNVDQPSPNINYAWHDANGRLITRGQYYMVNGFNPEESVYQCRITGRDDSTGANYKGEITHVIIHKVPKKQIEMTVGLQTAVVREGDFKEIHCELDSGDGLVNEVPTTRWLFNGQELNARSMLQYGLGREDHSYTSILTVRSFRKDNDGMYACVRRDGTKMQVRIIVEKLKGHLEVSPESIRTDIGGKAEFHCQISTSTLNTELKWTFEPKNSGTRVNIDFSRWVRHDSPTTPQTSFIELDNAERRDEGFYHCASEKDLLYSKAELILNKRGRSKIIIITPERVTVRPRQLIRMFCRVSIDGIPQGTPKFYFTNNRPVDTTPSFTQRTSANGEVELIVAGGLERDAGQIPVICRDGPDERKGLIVVTTECPPGQRPCRDGGSCIPQDGLCNGVRDCADGSDEDASYCKQCDPLTKQCEDYNGKVPLKSFYQAHWECDGEDDCGNFYDESMCNKPEYLACGGTTKKCEGVNNVTIPKAFVCDNEDDCPGGTDERNCRVPQIRSPTPQPFRVAVNGRVTLTCRATGSPPPRIIWRFNWGCLPDKNRMKTINSYNNCVESVSRLEISQFQRGDDGIYNCEALIGQKRVLSNDYSVTLTN